MGELEKELSADSLRFHVDVSVRYHTRRRRFFDSLNNTVLFAVLVFNTAAFANVIPIISSIALELSSLFTTILVAMTLVGRMSGKARDHEDLRRSFIKLQQEMELKRDQTDHGMIASWESKRLEIEIDEPPINRVVHALCYNEAVRSLEKIRESDKAFVRVGFHHRVFGWFTRAFDDSLKLESS